MTAAIFPIFNVAGNFSSVSTKSNVLMNVNVDVYVAGPASLSQVPGGADAILIYTNTRFRTEHGQTSSKASLWYSPPLGRFVKIERNPIFLSPTASGRLGMLGQKSTLEPTRHQSAESAKPEQPSAKASALPPVRPALPANARWVTDMTWECVIGYWAYEQRLCVLESE